MTTQSTSTRKIRWLVWGVCLIAILIAGAVALRSQYFDTPTNSAATEISTSKPLSNPSSAQKPVDSTSSEPTSAEQTPASESGHALDPVLDLARTALAQLREQVDDYQGRLIKRERINGKLGNEVQMELKVRTRREADGKVTRPLSAYLKFLEPKSARGREVIWVEGANGNKLTGHEGGLLNLVRVELEPTGMLAMIDNKYPITEIGLARLVEKLIEKGERDRKVGPCEVQIRDDQRVGDRTCRLIQVTHPEPDPRFDFHIAQVFIDVERMIPLRYAAFMWPKQPGGEPELEEEYTYLDVELNVGLTDKDFDPDNPAYKFP